MRARKRHGTNKPCPVGSSCPARPMRRGMEQRTRGSSTVVSAVLPVRRGRPGISEKSTFRPPGTIRTSNCSWSGCSGKAKFGSTSDFAAREDPLGTPHRHRLGRLSSGRHLLTVCVNNAMIHPLGDKGQCYTDDTQTIWNGIVRRIELRADDSLWIERQRIFPSNDGTVRVELTLGNEQDKPVSGTVEATMVERAAGAVVGKSKTPFEIVPGTGFEQGGTDKRAVREITGQTSTGPETLERVQPRAVRIEIAASSRCRRGRIVRFRRGHLRLSHRRPHRATLAINGRPTFIRGNLDRAGSPLSGHPSCDVDAWRQIFRVYKEYGLNQVRFHSWCPPEAAFQAADELGIYIQAEVLWIDTWRRSSRIRRIPRYARPSKRRRQNGIARSTSTCGPRCGRCSTPTATIRRSSSS